MEMTKGVGWIYGKNEGFRFSMEDMNGFRLSMEDVKMTSRFYRKEVEIIHEIFFPFSMEKWHLFYRIWISMNSCQQIPSS